MLGFIKGRVGFCVCLFTILAMVVGTIAQDNQPEFGTLTHIKQLKERTVKSSSSNVI